MNKSWLGERIQQIRLKNGLTQGELAIKAGVTRSVIESLEKGICQTTGMLKIIKIATALGVDVALFQPVTGSEFTTLYNQLPYEKQEFIQEIITEWLAEEGYC